MHGTFVCPLNRANNKSEIEPHALTFEHIYIFCTFVHIWCVGNCVGGYDNMMNVQN